MKWYLLLAVLFTATNCCFAAPTVEPAQTSTATSNAAFLLTCTVESETLKCTLRNSTTNTIPYSSLTIGYREAIVLEQYDASVDSWHLVPERDSRMRLTISMGASTGDVKYVAPGGIVPPARSCEVAPTFSFTVNLEDYALPEYMSLRLRVTQIMGTFLGSDLQVWKGRVVSTGVDYRPNQRIDTYFQWPRTAIGKWSF